MMVRLWWLLRRRNTMLQAQALNSPTERLHNRIGRSRRRIGIQVEAIIRKRVMRHTLRNRALAGDSAKQQC